MYFTFLLKKKSGKILPKLWTNIIYRALLLDWMAVSWFLMKNPGLNILFKNYCIKTKFLRNLPPERVAQTFFGRKFRYAINAQVLSGIDRLIYDLVLGAPGRMHDSVVWRTSPVKVHLEEQHPLFRVLGDSAYPKSKLLITPYSTAQAANDESKR